MSAYYEFKLPAKILSGDGALEHIPHELDSLGAHRPLLLSDQGLEQVGTVKIVQAALRQGGMAAAETFCRIPPDSSIQVVNQIAGLYRQAQCDSLIAVGGGSVIDTAKGVGMVLAQAGSDLLDSAGCEVLPRGAHVPFVAVPTTAGTGSALRSTFPLGVSGMLSRGITTEGIMNSVSSSDMKAFSCSASSSQPSLTT